MTTADVSTRSQWGLGDAAIGWVAAQLLGAVAVTAALIAGDWRLFTPVRPGGHIGRAVGQLASDDALVDDAFPVVWQQLTIVPLWIGMLGGAWFAAAAFGRRRTLAGGFSVSDVGNGLLAGLLLQVPILPIVVLVMEAIFGDLRPTGRALSLTDRVDSPAEVVLLYAVAAVGAPVVEEVFYRGIVQPALIRRIGPTLGILVAGLIFGAVHFAVVELIPLAVVGIVFGVLAHRSGRLAPAIIGHMTFNAFTLTSLLLA